MGEVRTLSLRGGGEPAWSSGEEKGAPDVASPVVNNEEMGEEEGDPRGGTEGGQGGGMGGMYRREGDGAPVTAAELHEFAMWREWARIQKEDLSESFSPDRMRVLVICTTNTVFSKALEAALGASLLGTNAKVWSRAVGGGNDAWCSPGEWSYYTGAMPPTELVEEGAARGRKFLLLLLLSGLHFLAATLDSFGLCPPLCSPRGRVGRVCCRDSLI